MNPSSEVPKDGKPINMISMGEEYVDRAANLQHTCSKINLNDQPIFFHPHYEEIACILSCTRAYFMSLNEYKQFHIYNIFFNGEMQSVKPRMYENDPRWVAKELKDEELMEKIPLFGEKDRVFDISRQLTAGTFLNFDPSDTFQDHDDKTIEQNESSDRFLCRIFCVVGERSGYMRLLDLNTREETCRFGSHAEPISQIKSLHNGQIVSMSDTYLRFWKVVAEEDQIRILVLGTHMIRIKGCGSLTSFLPSENLPRCSIVTDKDDIWKKRFVSNFLVGTSHGKIFDIEFPPLPTAIPADAIDEYDEDPTECDILMANRVQKRLYKADNAENGGLHIAFKIKKAAVESMTYCFGGQFVVLKSHRSVYLFRRTEELEDEDEGEDEEDEEEDEEEEKTEKSQTSTTTTTNKTNFEKVGVINLREDYDGYDFFAEHPDILYFVGCQICASGEQTNEISFKEFRYDTKNGFRCQNYLTGNAEVTSMMETSVKGRVVNPYTISFSKDMQYVFCGCDNTTSFFKLEVIPRKFREVMQSIADQDEKRIEMQESTISKIIDCVKVYKKKIKKLKNQLVEVSESEEEEEEDQNITKKKKMLDEDEDEEEEEEEVVVEERVSTRTRRGKKKKKERKKMLDEDEEEEEEDKTQISEEMKDEDEEDEVEDDDDEDEDDENIEEEDIQKEKMKDED